jgi:hypothetical protein
MMLSGTAQMADCESDRAARRGPHIGRRGCFAVDPSAGLVLASITTTVVTEAQPPAV